MLLAPSPDDVRVIVRASGTAVGVFGVAMGVLALVPLVTGDINATTALACGAAPAIALGARTRMIVVSRRHLTWTRGVITAVLTWLLCALVASVPLYLSGHFPGWIDAAFDAVSGLTNTGLTMVADLDHLPTAYRLLRTLLEAAGGMTFLVVSLGLLTATTVLASPMTPSDVRDERILLRPGRLWRRSWRTVALLVGVGLVLVTTTLALAGVPPSSLPTTAISLTVTAATTGGFTPMSGPVGMYHSFALEWVLMTLMLGGATSVTVHALAARGLRNRIPRDLDTRIFTLLLFVTIVGAVVGLARAGTYDAVWPLFRHATFMSVAAITTTGLSTVEPKLLATDFGLVAPAALVTAMAVGGMAGSMAGGFKTLRAGFLLKGVVGDVRRVLLPESAYTRAGYEREGRREILTDAHIRSAATTVLLSLGAILVGAAVLLWVDGSVALREAILTATSAVSNVGLDTGILTAADPMFVKATFAAIMLLGRLEWLAVFASVGYLVAGLRGQR